MAHQWLPEGWWREIQEIYFRWKLLKTPEIQLEELGNPLKFDWINVSGNNLYGHGTTTPLQAFSVYAALVMAVK